MLLSKYLHIQKMNGIFIEIMILFLRNPIVALYG